MSKIIENSKLKSGVHTFFKMGLILLSVFTLSRCAKDAGNIDPIKTDPDFVPVIKPKGTEKYLTTSSDFIFNQEVLHTFELKIPEKSLATINSNPAAEQYVEGMLIFLGDTISPVGIRYKGSIGAFVGCLSGQNFARPSGYKTCTKLSMKVDIRWKDRKDRFYTLNKLQFHSQNLDPSQMRERVGYHLFRSMGIPAPRAVHAKLVINGKYNGLFVLTEQIDSRFAKYNFKDDEGNIYKEVWPLTWLGKPQGADTYLQALETNEDNSPSVQIIKEFGEKIAGASKEDVPKIIQQYMDIDKIMTYIAVDRTIRHDDGPFHWYCGNGSCTNHNYFWYEEPINRKLHLIPWDMDNAFENIITNSNPVTPIADQWGAISNNCQPFAFGLFRSMQWSANCDKLTAGWAGFQKEYEEKREKLKKGPLSAQQINQVIDKWSVQIRQATIEAKSVNTDAITVQQWESAMNTLKMQLDFAREK